MLEFKLAYFLEWSGINESFKYSDNENPIFFSIRCNSEMEIWREITEKSDYFGVDFSFH